MKANLCAPHQSTISRYGVLFTLTGPQTARFTLYAQIICCRLAVRWQAVRGDDTSAIITHIVSTLRLMLFPRVIPWPVPRSDRQTSGSKGPAPLYGEGSAIYGKTPSRTAPHNLALHAGRRTESFTMIFVVGWIQMAARCGKESKLLVNARNYCKGTPTSLC